jgi:hypothetical protein
MQVFNAATDFSEDDFHAVHCHSCKQQHKHTTPRSLLSLSLFSVQCLFSVDFTLASCASAMALSVGASSEIPEKASRMLQQLSSSVDQLQGVSETSQHGCVHLAHLQKEIALQEYETSQADSELPFKMKVVSATSAFLHAKHQDPALQFKLQTKVWASLNSSIQTPSIQWWSRSASSSDNSNTSVHRSEPSK